MVAANYDACEARVLAAEGGYGDNPNDPGGPTKYGITIYDARLYWKKSATLADVKNMPKSVAQDIYRHKYWDALDCDALPSGLDYTVFDYGVNSGIGRAGRVLRQVLGLPTDDYRVTAAVVTAIKERDAADLIRQINGERLKFLEGLTTWEHFGRGWKIRVDSVDSTSLRMAHSESPPPIAAVSMVPAKGITQATDLLAHFGADLKAILADLKAGHDDA